MSIQVQHLCPKRKMEMGPDNLCDFFEFDNTKGVISIVMQRCRYCLYFNGIKNEPKKSKNKSTKNKSTEKKPPKSSEET